MFKNQVNYCINCNSFPSFKTIVSNKLPSSLQSFQWLLQLWFLMVHSCLCFTYPIFNPCSSFPGRSSFIFRMALKLVDILLMPSVYCWSMSIWYFLGDDSVVICAYLGLKHYHVPLKRMCQLHLLLQVILLGKLTLVLAQSHWGASVSILKNLLL